MEYSFSTLGCPEDSLDEVMALAAEYQIKALELRALAGRLDLPAYFAETWGSPKKLAAHVAAAGCRVAALDTSFRLVGHEEADREALRAFLPWAEGFGGVNLRVFDGGKFGAEDDLKRMVEAIRWWRDERAKAGWKSDIIIETHDALLRADSIGALNAAIGADGAPAILWDTHHTWQKGGEDPLETWAAIHQHVVHVHVKDSLPVASARHPFTYTLPADGRFPMKAILARLRSDHFSGIVSLEWERKWHPYLPPLADALRHAAAVGWW